MNYTFQNLYTCCRCSEMFAHSSLFRNFGNKIMPIKPLVPKLPKLLEDRDKNVREEAKSLIIEIYRWIKQAIKPQMSNFNPIQVYCIQDWCIYTLLTCMIATPLSIENQIRNFIINQRKVYFIGTKRYSTFTVRYKLRYNSLDLIIFDSITYVYNEYSLYSLCIYH